MTRSGVSADTISFFSASMYTLEEDEEDGQDWLLTEDEQDDAEEEEGIEP